MRSSTEESARKRRTTTKSSAAGTEKAVRGSETKVKKSASGSKEATRSSGLKTKKRSANSAKKGASVKKKTRTCGNAPKNKRSRKSSAASIVKSILCSSLVLLIVLLLFALAFPTLRIGYGNLMASHRDYDRALAIANKAEKQDGLTAKANDLRRTVAGFYINDGRYDTALNMLSSLPQDDEDTSELIRKARARKADGLYEADAYSEAAELYDLLPDSMGAGRYADCLCCMAVEAYLRGDELEMQQLLLSADDAESRIADAIVKVAGNTAEAERLMREDVFNAAAITRLKNNMQAVLDARENLATGRIAAGDLHTVGLKSDGTVLACGDNSFGQCDVGFWKDIVMVAAGAKHTAALKKDGTVICTGDNACGQLQTDAWSDIIMIACSQYDTLGLKSDGSVVSCGMHGYNVASWHDVTSICGGAYSAGCLYNRGAMHSTHKTAQMGAGKLLSSLSISGAYSAGITFDGALCSSFNGAPAWTGLVRVTASSTGMLAITNQGEIKSFFFRPSDSVEIKVDGSATEIASSGTHHVVLTSDGRVWSFGENGSGQCDTEVWNLN